MTILSVPDRGRGSVASAGDRWALAIGLAATLFGWGLRVGAGESARGGAYAQAPLYLLAAIPAFAYLAWRARSLVAGCLLAFLFWSLAVVHAAIAQMFAPDIALLGLWLKAPPLMLALGLMAATLRAYPEDLAPALLRATKIFFACQLAVMAYELLTRTQFVLGGAPVYRHYFLPIFRASGLLREPSHLAAAMTAPIVFAALFPRAWWRSMGWGWTGAGLLILVLDPSATLLAAAGVALALRGARAGGKGLWVYLGFGAVLAWLPNISVQRVEYNPIGARVMDTYHLLTGSSAVGAFNVSTVVLGKAVHVVKRALTTQPWGYGYDNCLYANTLFAHEYTQYFVALNAENLGSSVAKAVVEFGWFGLVCAAALLIVLARQAFGRRSQPLAVWSLLMLGQLLVNVTRSSGYYEQAAPLILGTGYVLAFWRPRARSEPASWRGAPLSLGPAS